MEVLSAVEPLVSAITGLINVVDKIKDDDTAVQRLDLTIVEVWKVLEMVGKFQLQGNDMSLQNQVKTLTKWCYDAEDLMDKLALKVTKHKRDSVWGKLTEGIPEVYQNLTKSGEINDLQKRLNDILGQWRRILKEEIHQSKTITHPCNGTHGVYMSNTLIGRKDDIERIVQKLLSRDVDNGIAIIGMCGLGKSSLARAILNDKEIVDQFSRRLWVEVRDGRFVWDNIKKDIEELGAPELSASNKHHDNLLIVFDNLLHLDHIEWHRFWNYKKDQEKESKDVRIIITTRNPRILELTFTTPYYLEPLSDDCCAEVIKENAKLYNTYLSEPRDLLTVKSVAKRCEGLPLVAELFGIVIAKCNDDRRDAIAKEGRLWHTREFKREILPKFIPSYIDMKSELRRCLAYFSLFPVDHHFNTDDLVHLWVGECFVQLNEETTSLKQIREKYVDDLKERSILQSSGPLYKLHSFGKDFAMLAASGTCLHLDQGVPSLSSSDENTRHLSLSCQFNSKSWSELEILRKLRTFLSLYAESNIGLLGKIPPNLYNSVSRLRVLSLKRTNVDELPAFIDRLKHLRYLDVSFTLITRLPKTFPKLHALKILKLKNTNLSHLPEKFHKLTSLRFLDWEVHDIRKLRIPCHIGKLSGLESLPLFDIGEKEGYSIRELRHIKNLQGSICIENLQLVANTEEAKEAMLHEKCDLKRIVLQWKTQSIRNCALDEDILAGLQPHSNVKELKIRNYGADKFPNWISNSMLEKIQLMGCRSCCLPALGKLQCLKTLVLEDLESTTHVSCRSDDDTDTAVCFPLLESLEFYNMTQLREWSGLQENDMPCLCQLKFVNCPKIGDLLPSLDHLLPRLESFVLE